MLDFNMIFIFIIVVAIIAWHSFLQGHRSVTEKKNAQVVKCKTSTKILIGTICDVSENFATVWLLDVVCYKDRYVDIM